jgi:hypothetical protein
LYKTRLKNKTVLLFLILLDLQLLFKMPKSSDPPTTSQNSTKSLLKRSKPKKGGDGKSIIEDEPSLPATFDRPTGWEVSNPNIQNTDSAKDSSDVNSASAAAKKAISRAPAGTIISTPTKPPNKKKTPAGGQHSTQLPPAGGSANEPPASRPNLPENSSIFSGLTSFFRGPPSLDEHGVRGKQIHPVDQVETPQTAESKLPSEQNDNEDQNVKTLIQRIEDGKEAEKALLQLTFQRGQEWTAAALEELRRENQALQDENESIKKRSKWLSDNAQQLERQLEKLEEKNKQLENDKSNLSDRLQDAQYKYSSLSILHQDEMNRLQGKIKSRDERITITEQDNIQLRQCIHRMSKPQEPLRSEDSYIDHFQDLKNQIESWVAGHSKQNANVLLERRTQNSVLAKLEQLGTYGIHTTESFRSSLGQWYTNKRTRIPLIRHIIALFLFGRVFNPFAFGLKCQDSSDHLIFIEDHLFTQR